MKRVMKGGGPITMWRTLGFFLLLLMVASPSLAQRAPIVIEASDAPTVGTECNPRAESNRIVRTTSAIYYCDDTQSPPEWALKPSAGGSPGGADTNVQFNNASSFDGDSTFTFNDTTKEVKTKILNKVRYANQYADSGAGTSCADPWLAWEDVYDANAKRIHFPAGYYKGVLNITTEVILTGDGEEQTVLCNEYTGADSSNRVITVDGTAFSAPNYSTFTIEDIDIIQYSTSLASGGTPFHVQDIANFYIRNVRIMGDATADKVSSGYGFTANNFDFFRADDMYIGGHDSPGGMFAIGWDLGNGDTDTTGNILFNGGICNRCLIGMRLGEGMVTSELNNIHLDSTKFVVNGSGTAINNAVGIEANQQVRNLVLTNVQIESYEVGIWLISPRRVMIEGANIAAFGYCPPDAGNGCLIADDGRGIVVTGSVQRLEVKNSRFANTNGSGTCDGTQPCGLAVEIPDGLGTYAAGTLTESMFRHLDIDTTVEDCGDDTHICNNSGDDASWATTFIGAPIKIKRRNARLILQGGPETTNTDWGGIYFNNNTPINTARIVGVRSGADDAAYLKFSTKATGGSVTEAVRIQDDQTTKFFADILIDSDNTSISSGGVGNFDNATNGNFTVDFDQDDGGTNYFRVLTGGTQAFNIANNGDATFTFDTFHDNDVFFGSDYPTNYLKTAPTNGALSRHGATASDIFVNTYDDSVSSSITVFRVPVSGAHRWDYDKNGAFDFSMAPVSTSAMRFDDNNGGATTRVRWRVTGYVEADDGLQVGAGTDVDMEGLRFDRTTADPILSWDESETAFSFNKDLGTITCARFGNSSVIDAANSACICRDNTDDTLFHDKDCDGTRDTGEGFMDPEFGRQDTQFVTVCLEGSCDYIATQDSADVQIEAALNAKTGSASNPVIVLLLPGEYRVADTIDIDVANADYTTLMGLSAESTVIKWYKTSGTTSGTMISVDTPNGDLEHFEIKNITLEQTDNGSGANGKVFEALSGEVDTRFDVTLTDSIVYCLAASQCFNLDNGDVGDPTKEASNFIARGNRIEFSGTVWRVDNSVSFYGYNNVYLSTGAAAPNNTAMSVYYATNHFQNAKVESVGETATITLTDNVTSYLSTVDNPNSVNFFYAEGAQAVIRDASVTLEITDTSTAQDIYGAVIGCYYGSGGSCDIDVISSKFEYKTATTANYLTGIYHPAADDTIRVSNSVFVKGDGPGEEIDIRTKTTPVWYNNSLFPNAVPEEIGRIYYESTSFEDISNPSSVRVRNLLMKSARTVYRASDSVALPATGAAFDGNSEYRLYDATTDENASWRNERTSERMDVYGVRPPRFRVTWTPASASSGTVIWGVGTCISKEADSGTATQTTSSDIYMEDTTSNWVVGEWVGQTITNTTDSETCTVTSNDATSVTCDAGLSGSGSWDTSDGYSFAAAAFPCTVSSFATVTDTATASGVIHQTEWTDFPAYAFAPNSTFALTAYRNADTDTMTGDAELVLVEVEYGVK